MAALSGQKTVTAAGTEVVLGTIQVNAPVMVKALDTNTGKIYIGNNGDGTVSSTTGLVLLAGESIVFEWAGNLSTIMVDSSVNGEGVAWLALNV